MRRDATGRWRIPSLVALVFVLAACASEPVVLATDKEHLGCFLANTTGLLVPDATAGTAIVEEDMAKITAPVLWPVGYTARRSGNEVEVMDRGGHVVARTGQRYNLLGGYNSANEWIACDGGVYAPLSSPK